MTVPVNYRFPRQVTPGIAQSAEVYAEQGEEVPYPEGYVSTPSLGVWPPPTFSSLPSEDDPVTNASLGSQLPTPYDLEWVQGDTASFSWLFTDVLWTPEDPAIEDPLAPTWEKVEWAASIRNPYLFSALAVDRWTPVNNSQYVWWRSNSWIGDFTVTADVYLMPDTDPQQYATKVTATLPADWSRRIIPGNHYRWDLQTRTPGLDEETHEDDEVRTHLSGRVRVTTQWTTS